MSIPHQATLKMLPPSQLVGQQQAAPSKRTRLHEALACGVLKEVVAVEGVFSRLPKAVYPSRCS